jgi:hypothetical protein
MLDDSLSKETKESWNKRLDKKEPSIPDIVDEHCTETEFREIEILRTKLSDIAKAIYYHEGKENPTVERIREIVQDCCFELMDLKKPKQEEPVSEELEEAIDTYLATYFGGEKEKQDWPFLKKMAIHFAAWQKQQLMKDAVDGWIEEPECLLWRVISNNLEGDFVVKNKLQDGDPVKVIIIKED